MNGDTATWEHGAELPAAAPTIAGFSPRRRIGRLLREPLLQFLALGAAFFVVAHVVEAHRQSADRTILVDQALVKRLSSLYELQMGAVPTGARLDGMIEDYVHDEVMYREAIKSGLDQDDEIIRRRLIQKLEFLDRDLFVVPEPTEAQLQAFYQQHQIMFTSPATVSFSQVYFSPDAAGDARAQERAEQALRWLSAHPAPRAPQLGDRFPLQYDYSGMTRADVVQVFGQTEIADAVFAEPTGRWVGPVHSGYGWHLLYLGARRDAAVQPFAQVRGRVREEFLEAARQDDNRRQYAGMRSRYTVVRTDNAAQGAK